MSENFQPALTRFKDKYSTWVLGSIDETYTATRDGENGSTPLAAFILVSSAIDFMGGFLEGIDSFDSDSSGKIYRRYLERYMPEYNSKDVYRNVCCRLAHNYTIGDAVALIHHNSNAHDPLGSHGDKIINFENFYADFRIGVEKYFLDLQKDKDLQKRFLRRASLGFADVAKA
jgi:hypothetical protein